MASGANKETGLLPGQVLVGSLTNAEAREVESVRKPHRGFDWGSSFLTYSTLYCKVFGRTAPTGKDGSIPLSAARTAVNL